MTLLGAAAGINADLRDSLAGLLRCKASCSPHHAIYAQTIANLPSSVIQHLKPLPKPQDPPPKIPHASTEDWYELTTVFTDECIRQLKPDLYYSAWASVNWAGNMDIPAVTRTGVSYKQSNKIYFVTHLIYIDSGYGTKPATSKVREILPLVTDWFTQLQKYPEPHIELLCELAVCMMILAGEKDSEELRLPIQKFIDWLLSKGQGKELKVLNFKKNAPVGYNVLYHKRVDQQYQHMHVHLVVLLALCKFKELYIRGDSHTPVYE